jgi:hypothetical protein
METSLLMMRTRRDSWEKEGDHVICPFQCDLCHFRNLQGQSPIYGSGVLNDTETMELIRQDSIDAFWSR